MNSRRWYTRQWRCSKGSKDIRTEHRTESNLEPFDTGSVRTGTLLYSRVRNDIPSLAPCMQGASDGITFRTRQSHEWR